MSRFLSSRVKSGFSEFGLIVFGVLVALLAESWWSDKQDQRAERKILVDAISEFQENIKILDEDISLNKEVYAYLLRIEAISDSELLSLSDAETSELLAVEQQHNAAFDPAMGSIDAIVRSGDLRFVSDHQLRGELSRWSALLTRATRMELQHTKSQLDWLGGRVPAYKSDGKWTAAERREIREILANTKFSLKMTLDTMVELRQTAERILKHLDEVTQSRPVLILGLKRQLSVVAVV